MFLVILHGNTGTNHCINEKYSMLWLRRLGHISIERTKRFLLWSSWNYWFYEFWFMCWLRKRKADHKTKKAAMRSNNILDITYTGIFCLDMSSVIGNTLSLLWWLLIYVFILASQQGRNVDAFKFSKAEIVRSDRGREYYRYTG